MTKFQQSKVSPLSTKSNTTAISAAGPLPLYYQLYETLRSQILDGIWTNGDFFPPITVLASEFNMATVTVRQALSLLQKDGLVNSQRGAVRSSPRLLQRHNRFSLSQQLLKFLTSMLKTVQKLKRLMKVSECHP